MLKKEVTWQWPRPFQGRFVTWRLGLAMFNPHAKFEVSMITCNEDMKGNAKVKNSGFESPLGRLKGWLTGMIYGSMQKYIVDFLFVIIALFR